MVTTRLRQQTLALLSRREHSRAELERKLAGKADPDALKAELDRLAELGLQSDIRMAESYVRAKAPRHGVAKLRHELAQRGVDKALIHEVLEHLSAENGDELTRARTLWQSRFQSTPNDAKEWARQARFLAGRGFTPDTIRRLLKENPDEFA